MKRSKFSFVQRIMMFNIALFLVGCAVASPTPTSTEKAISLVSPVASTPVTPTPTFIPATHTPSVTPSSMPTLSSTPTLTPTPTHTPTVQPTATRRPSPIPTPPGTDPIEQVLWLYETNNGCQLPCWWGIVPGQTTWEVAERFFNSFTPDIPFVSGTQGISYSPQIPLAPEIFGADKTSPIYSVREGIVEVIVTDVAFVYGTPSGYLTPYELSTFLATYGEPTEVWLSTYPTSIENDLPFGVVLFYPAKGIVAGYSDNGERVGDLVYGCPQDDPASVLRLSSPDLDVTFEQIKDRTSALRSEYLSLEEATGMNVATFYQIFQNPGNTTCLETPADLWR